MAQPFIWSPEMDPNVLFILCGYFGMPLGHVGRQNWAEIYSLVLNRRRTSCIRHNLDFPWSSCIAVMFLSKKLGLSCISPWFSTFPACFIAWWCHCYNYVRMPCLLIHPGLWVMSSALLVLHQGFQKKNIMSSNTTRLLLSTREYGLNSFIEDT